MRFDSAAQAYLRTILKEEFTKQSDNGLTIAVPDRPVQQKFSGTAIDSRESLPYNPTKMNSVIRSGLSSEATNPVLKAANEYVGKKFGTRIKTDPAAYSGSSLRKQYAIGKLGELAAKHDPAYESAVFDDYKKNRPDLVRQANAHDYRSLVAASYGAAERETGEQFNHLPLKIQFHPGHLNYHDSNEMMRDMFLHGNLTTYQGGDRHEFLHKIHPKLGVTSNDVLRAVHDAYSHGIMGSSFGPKGEEIAYQTHAQMYSPLARIAVAGETRQQNSLVNYTTKNLDILRDMESARKERNAHINTGNVEAANSASAKLRDIGSKWRYADQVSVALPSKMVDADYSGEVPHYVKSLLKDKQSDVNPVYDVDRDHLGVVQLARHYNTGSHQHSDAASRGVLNSTGAMSDLHHMISLHGYTGVSRNPF